MFVKYLDGNGSRRKICAIKEKEKQLWDRPWKDLQLFHITLTLSKLKDSIYFVMEMLHL